MVERDPARLGRLLKENALKPRAETLIAQWATLGVAVELLPFDQYWHPLEQAKAGGAFHLQHCKNILEKISTFRNHDDIVIMAAWNPGGEPALQIKSNHLLLSASSLEKMYPNGFILFERNEGRELTIDFDCLDGCSFAVRTFQVR